MEHQTVYTAEIHNEDVILEILSLKYVAKSSHRETDASGNKLTFGWRTDSMVENRIFGLRLFRMIKFERYLLLATLAAH